MDYSRQLKLDFIDNTSQKTLQQARICVFGAGGLAHTCLAYLAGAGVGNICIVDADTIEPHNLHRQILFTPQDLSLNKARICARQIHQQNPQCKTTFIDSFLSGATLYAHLQAFELIIDCTDDPHFSLELNHICCELNKAVVFANASQMQGQLYCFSGSADDACLYCLWGDSLTQSGANCDALGVLGPIPGILGALQATEAIKLLIKHPSAAALRNTLIDYNFLTHRFKKLRLNKNPQCLHHHTPWQALAQTYHRSLGDAIVDGLHIIDICNQGERAKPLAITHLCIPASELIDNHHQYLNHNTDYLLVCKTGRRSQILQTQLTQKGYSNVFSYVGQSD